MVHKDAIANIFGLSELTKKHWVTFDSHEEDAFHVHIDGRVVKLKANNGGIIRVLSSRNL